MVEPPPNQQNQSSLCGPAAILWDIMNCPIPRDVSCESVAGNIRKGFGLQRVLKFTAYGDFNLLPSRIREGLHRTGVELNDVPKCRKDAADKAILTGLFLFALDYSPPASIMVITGDVDFAQALNSIHQRGYTVILATPAGVNVSPTLISAAEFVCDWPSLAHGMVFLPSSTPLMHLYPAPYDTAGNFRGCCYSQNEKGSTTNRDFIAVYDALCGYNYTDGLTSGCHGLWERSWEINDLKAQVVKLVEVSGGNLPLTSLSSDYEKYYRRPLCESEDGGLRLLNLLQKMSDVLTIVDKGQMKFVFLGNSHRINVLKQQLVKLVELSGGSLPLDRLSVDYKQYYKRPLWESGDGELKLLDLLQKMSDALTIIDKGQMKFVYLQNGEPETCMFIM